MPPLPICTDWTSDDYDIYEADDSTDDESFLDEETCQKSLRDFGIAMSRQEQSEKTCQYNTCHLYTCAHLSSQQFDYNVLHGFRQFSRDWRREV